MFSPECITRMFPNPCGNY